MSNDLAHEPVAAPAQRREPRPTTKRRDLKGMAEANALLVLLILVGAFFAVLPASRSVFLSTDNLSVLLGNQATVALLALAAILPLVSGYFDFSLGANAATSTVLAAGLMSRHGTPLWLVCVSCLVVSSAIGLMNGILVTRFRLNAFVTTLAVATLLGGVIQWYTGGQTIITGISTRLVDFGSLNLFGIPEVVYVVVVVAVVLWYVLNHTPYGRSLYAVGANPRAAKLVGIRSGRYVALSFVMAGATAGVVGLLQLARTGSATADSGNSLLFPALAAAFLGATAVRPGFFNVVGTMIGVLFVSVTVSGLTLAGAQAWVSPVFNGAALLSAVGLSTYLGRHRGRAD
jgi:ribose/xylose/arabinose/galactoside ABC-type transport system permease subunit